MVISDDIADIYQNVSIFILSKIGTGVITTFDFQNELSTELYKTESTVIDDFRLKFLKHNSGSAMGIAMRRAIRETPCGDDETRQKLLRLAAAVAFVEYGEDCPADIRSRLGVKLVDDGDVGSAVLELTPSWALTY